ncbi:hypothetical protein BD410DRAFT_817220 [Rickenella mellea]|uniref:Protein kinase domain-containing protein n=1 Tax=Rickenella mellea TaxID=50990 RepID=A0A4Y7PID2_9AGAM|nr:hypothetical protein BD410DRAFT_817220 [Rickenella mellea]
MVERAIEEHGYMLRPRYHVGWVPSWSDTWISPELCEDSARSLIPAVLDAKRISDGSTVVIKRVSKRCQEYEIAKFLSTPDMLEDERNHCIPILDDFFDPSDGTRFIVMAFLRHFYEPEFECMDEVLDFMLQTLTAISFLHEKGVAHRDCALNNIIYDPSVRRLAKRVRRSSVLPVRYYLTDFGISTRFKNPGKPRRVVGIDCQDQDVPELSTDIPYDPFPVDIFTLGNLYQKRILNRYENADFLRPLILAMTHSNPEGRPTAIGVLIEFRHLVRRETWSSRVWRLRRRDEGRLSRFFQDVRFVARDWIKLLMQFFRSKLHFHTLV